MSSIPALNRRLVLRERPSAHIDPSLEGNGTFAMEEKPIPAVQDGQVLVKILYTSIDPAMRGRLREARSYLNAVPIGGVMRSYSVGTVLASRAPNFPEGENVVGWIGWQEYAVVDATEVKSIAPDSEPMDSLGLLGLAGQTAYWGFFDVAAPKESDVVVVTGAAGSVGSIVVQLAKIKGCKVIAVAGGEAKCKWLKDELGADIVLDYKAEPMAIFQKTYRQTLEREGWADVLFENVGGPLLDTSLTCMKPMARIAMCGMIASYNGDVYGYTNLSSIVRMRIRMQGFVLTDYFSRFEESTPRLLQWAKKGKLQCRMDVKEGGVDACPQALVDLFAGKNMGKRVVKFA